MENASQFSLPNQDGKTVTLEDFAGRWLVLYFYPKDDTPSCTIEACSFRDTHDEISRLGAQVVGVSKDTPNSHDKFKAKYDLSFTLLTDADAAVMKLYGAWGKKMFGVEGVLRKTFIITPDGKIAKEFGRVTPDGHGHQVAEALKELQAKAQ